MKKEDEAPNGEYIDFDVEDVVARKLPLKDYADSTKPGTGASGGVGDDEDSEGW